MAITVYADNYEAITGLAKPVEDAPVAVISAVETKVVEAPLDVADKSVEVK